MPLEATIRLRRRWKPHATNQTFHHECSDFFDGVVSFAAAQPRGHPAFVAGNTQTLHPIIANEELTDL